MTGAHATGGERRHAVLNEMLALLHACRYGDEQHLDEALDRIFRFGRSGGIARKLAPVLKGRFGTGSCAT